MVRKTDSALNNDFHKTVLDAIPSPVFVVQQDVRIVDFNAAASKMLADDRQLIIRRRAFFKSLLRSLQFSS
jgi:nitrogen-specific signal transduction histidine kinase